MSSPTAKGYFGILEDTLLGRWLPAYRRRRKRRLTAAPKFYFADVGVVNRLARRGEVVPGSELYGKAFENWVHHELRAFVGYREVDDELAYWRLPSGIEVDFVLGDVRLAVEAKASARIDRNHLKGLRSIAQEYPETGRRVVVCLEPPAPANGRRDRHPAGGEHSYAASGAAPSSANRTPNEPVAPTTKRLASR